MDGVTNGMRAAVLELMVPNLRWIKSGRSGQLGNCVEAARLPSGDVAVRNSRFPGSSVLIFNAAEMAAFVGGVADGDFADFAQLS